MFKKMNQPSDLGRVISELCDDGLLGIPQAGLIIGVLKISLWVSRIEKENVYEINGFDFNYYHWDDFPSFIEGELPQLTLYPNVDMEKWKKEVTVFGSKKRFCFCTCLALFLERHMQNSYNSPNNGQKKTMREIRKILSGDYQLPNVDLGSGKVGDSIEVYVTLHAGKKPIIQLNFSQSTVEKYSERLEGIVAYSVINAIKFSLENLQEPYRTLLEDMIYNEHLSWNECLPTPGRPFDWNWLPKFC